MTKHLTLASLVLLAASATLWALNEPIPAPPAPPGAGGPGQPPQGFPGGAPGFQPPGGGFPPGFQPPGRADHKEMIPTLITALGDEDPDVRRNVAHALAHIGRPAVGPLLEVLKDKDKSKASQANAAYVLGKIGSQAGEALPALTKALKGSDRELRRRAAFAIAHIVGGSPYQQGFQMGMPGMMGGSSARPRTADTIADPGLLLPGKSDDKPGERKGKIHKEETQKPPSKEGRQKPQPK